jgi:hypothetical protein
MAVPSQVPVRFPNGLSTDYPYGPLANFGQPHPFDYHYFADDFDILHGTYTQTKTGNGTIANTAVDGGRILFTTNSSTPLTTDIASLQLPAAGFKYAAGKKFHFMARIQVSDAVNAAFLAGMIQTTATPFTVTDGIYFSKATGSAANITLNCVSGSVNVGQLVIPTTAYTLANNTDIDLAFSIDRNGVVYAYVGSDLIVQPPNNSPAGQVRGPVGSVTPSSFTAALLNMTLALQSGTATSKTMQADFVLTSKER